MPGSKGMTIADITHPRYDLRYREWRKWRLTYHSGPQFIEQYLYQFTKREEATDFQIRKQLTYVPAFAKAAVDETKNSIFQRMADITRQGGSQTYSRAVNGLDNGVDLLGSTMTSYIGQKILPELLTMGRVGIYVDMPYIDPQATLIEGSGKRPYIYLYETEDIRSWTYDDSNAPNEFGSLLLRDYVYEYDQKTGLPKGQAVRFRHYWIDNGEVWVQFYDGDGTEIGQMEQSNDYLKETGPIKLPINRIPFVILEITDSLMTDIANYQIALMNLASSDLSYVLKANFPFYTEQFNSKTSSPYLRPPGMDNPGQASTANAAAEKEIKVGVSGGRMYPEGVERPGFIHPSSEPLKASMEKEQQLKEEIRLLCHLAITNLMPRATSAEAKGFDERSLESGLSAIGLELERAERMIAQYWDMYERGKEPAMCKYPEKYDLKSEKDRLDEATKLTDLIPKVPSISYAKEVAKLLATRLLGSRVKHDVLQKIFKEIDAAPGITAFSADIVEDVTAGICDLETAAKLRGYPDDTVSKANQQHADRLKRIQDAQTPPSATTDNPAGGGSVPAAAAARGNPDADATPGKSGPAEKAEANDKTTKDSTADTERGKGKNPRKDKVS